jgi:hypothetical protein
MPFLIDRETGKPVEVYEYDVERKLVSGKYDFSPKDTYRLRNREGELVDVKGDVAGLVLRDEDYTFPTFAGRAAELEEEAKEELYTQPGEQVAAALEGGLRGASLGLYDVVAADKHTKARRKYSPGIATVSEVAGAVVPAIASGGALSVAPAAIAARIGTGIQRGRGVAGAIAGGAAEGALFSAGQYVSDVALDNKELSAEGIMSEAGTGALWGGGIGGAIGVLGAGARAARKKVEAPTPIDDAMISGERRIGEPPTAPPEAMATPIGVEDLTPAGMPPRRTGKQVVKSQRISERLERKRAAAQRAEDAKKTAEAKKKAANVKLMQKQDAKIRKQRAAEGKAKEKAAAKAEKERRYSWDLRTREEGGAVRDYEEIVWVRPDRLDARWGVNRIEPSGKGAIEGRREGFERFLKEETPIQPPTVTIRKNGSVEFENGRHRFAVLRDRGVKEIPVSVDAEEAAALRSAIGGKKPVVRAAATAPRPKTVKAADIVDPKDATPNGVARLEKEVAQEYAAETAARNEMIRDSERVAHANPQIATKVEALRASMAKVGKFEAPEMGLQSRRWFDKPAKMIDDLVSEGHITADDAVKMRRVVKLHAVEYQVGRRYGAADARRIAKTAGITDKQKLKNIGNIAASLKAATPAGDVVYDIASLHRQARAVRRRGLEESPRDIAARVVSIPKKKGKPSVDLDDLDIDMEDLAQVKRDQLELYDELKGALEPHELAKYQKVAEESAAAKAAAKGDDLSSLADDPNFSSFLESNGVARDIGKELGGLSELAKRIMRWRMARAALGGAAMGYAPIMTAAVFAAQQVIKNRKKIAKAVAMFADSKMGKVGTVPLVSEVMSAPLFEGAKPAKTPKSAGENAKNRSLFKARTAELDAAMANPDAARRAIGRRINLGDEQLEQAFVDAAMRRIEYLAQEIPRDPRGPDALGIRGEWHPSPSALQGFSVKMKVSHNPAAILHDMASGRLSLDAAKTLEAVYPEMFRALQHEIIEKVSEDPDGLTYGQKNQLSILLDVPVNEQMKSEFISDMQEGYTEDTKPKDAPSQSASKLGEAEMSPTDRRAMR